MVSDDPSWIPAAELLAQEERLVLPSLSHDEAWELGNAFVAVGRSRDLPIVVSITARGQRVFHVGLPGSNADNVALTATVAGVTIAKQRGIDVAAGAARNVAMPLTPRGKLALKGRAKAVVTVNGTVEFGKPDTTRRTLG